MSTLAAGALPVSSGAPASTSGLAAPSVPPTEAKRKYDEVVAALGAIPVVSNKRAKCDMIETKSPLEKLLTLPKYFVRAVNPFMDISLVMFYGSEAHWSVPASVDPSDVTTISPEARAVQEHHADPFERMLVIWPGALDLLCEFYKDDNQWTHIVKLFHDTALSICSNDISGLKHKTEYVVEDRNQALIPPISDSASKHARGVNHPMLRDAINQCLSREGAVGGAVGHVGYVAGDPPAERPLTPDTIASLRALMQGQLTSGKPALTAKKYRSCFYADGASSALLKARRQTAKMMKMATTTSHLQQFSHAALLAAHRRPATNQLIFLLTLAVGHSLLVKALNLLVLHSGKSFNPVGRHHINAIPQAFPAAWC
ncbi:hypothetical protein FB451DRAFT_1188998 [Mycena latifolia]|nr:hypothetical protein FB451DRAFT_1188998 [Mycena latifolia]